MRIRIFDYSISNIKLKTHVNTGKYDTYHNTWKNGVQTSGTTGTKDLYRYNFYYRYHNNPYAGHYNIRKDEPIL